MNTIITPYQLEGRVNAPSSKSQAHRLLICAALSDAPASIICKEVSDDIMATADCLNSLGAEISYRNGKFDVVPIKTVVKGATLNCRESGSTLRFLLSVSAALGAEPTFLLSGKLPERPLSPLWEELESHGCTLSRPTANTILVKGRLSGGTFNLKSDVSSQFVSGILFSLPLLEGENSLIIHGEIYSADYINMTVNSINAFGADICVANSTFSARGKYSAKPEYIVEGDWSNGAFWLCADALSDRKIVVENLEKTSLQGDKKIEEILSSFNGGEVEIDASAIPDLVPALSVVASIKNKKTVIKNAARLKAKESDRLKSTTEMINSIGGKAKCYDDGIIIYGVSHFCGGIVDSFGDHRIAMSGAVASIKSSGKITILNSQAVNKSYPSFWSEFEKLGGKIMQEDV